MIWLYDCIVEIEMFIKLTSFCNINISDKYPVRSVKHKMNEKNSTLFQENDNFILIIPTRSNLRENNRQQRKLWKHLYEF